jgi:hypothetical protein
VIRDSDGRVLLTAWIVLQGCASPEHAEAEACLDGLRQSAELTHTHSFTNQK